MLRLNEKEEQIMQVLWRMERAFVKEILAELPEPKPPITTVSSIVRKLEGEGLIGHEAFGKTHRYYPIVKKSEYRRSFFRDFMDNYFGGSPRQVLSYFVKEEDMDPEDLERLLRELEDKEKNA